MHKDVIKVAGTLDGSMRHISGLLDDLRELAGQDGQAVPVLELQFGDILTRTGLHAADQDCLVIMAILPPCGDGAGRRTSFAPYRAPFGDEVEFIWHPEEGRYIGLRMIPIGSLPDERSVLDAILATSDAALEWMSPQPCKEQADE